MKNPIMNLLNTAPFAAHPELSKILQNPNITPQGLEQLCRLMCQQRGLDFNQVVQQAQQMMKNYKQ